MFRSSIGALRDSCALNRLGKNCPNLWGVGGWGRGWGPGLPPMSAIHPKADIAQRDRHVRFVPIEDIALSRIAGTVCRLIQTNALVF
jgi:hypothetical protein